MDFDNIIGRAVDYHTRFTHRKIVCYYRTDTACSCGSVDTFYGSNFNPTCSTCNGTGRVYTDTSKNVNCIVNKFAGYKGFLDEGQFVNQISGVSKIRLTCMLSDVLINDSSVTGVTYFDGADKVLVDGIYYQPKDTKRLLVGDRYTYEITLDEINR